MSLKRFALPSVIAALVAATPSYACSLGPAYQQPTNYQLARSADAIILGRVVAGELNESEPERSAITIQPLAAIKGAMPPADFTLEGMMLSSDVDREADVLSNPYEFERAHPVSYWGACIRYVFPRGTTVLFFLDRTSGGQWQPAGGPFSRWAEDVLGEDAPWIELTRLYLHAAELPEPDGLDLLARERDAQMARQDDPLARLVAADIDRSLGAARQGEFDDNLQAESSVASILDRMRKDAIEAGN